jgi:hypothetical protein
MKRDAASTLTLPRTPGQAASYPDADLVGIPWHSRAWHRIKAVFATHYRGRTPLEIRQAAEIKRLEETVYARDVRIFQLEHEVSLKTSENLIQAEELALWADVHQRDRLRVEADQAGYAFVAGHLAPKEPNAERRE